jgi:putative ABC transport system permease protein
MAIGGIALVIFVFTAVLMMAQGVVKTLSVTGSPDNILIFRKGTDREIHSVIDNESRNLIRSLPHVAKTNNGKEIISEEPVVVVTLKNIKGDSIYVTVRGVSPDVTLLRPNMRIIKGSRCNPSVRELILREALAGRIRCAKVGDSIQFAGINWKIAGIFSDSGTGFDSEIWTDAVQLQDAFHRRGSVSSITLKLSKDSTFETFKSAMQQDKRLSQYEAETEQEYFAKNSSFLTKFIKVVGLFVTLIFSIGAMFGAMITMYSAVANRTTEIGTMRALGFSRRNICIVFLAESEFIALIGGCIGVLLASFLQFFSISTLNVQTFSDLSFSFEISSGIIIISLFFSCAMGFLGGFLPSLRAARLNIVDALRSE